MSIMVGLLLVGGVWLSQGIELSIQANELDDNPGRGIQVETGMYPRIICYKGKLQDSFTSYIASNPVDAPQLTTYWRNQIGVPEVEVVEDDWSARWDDWRRRLVFWRNIAEESNLESDAACMEVLETLGNTNRTVDEETSYIWYSGSSESVIEAYSLPGTAYSVQWMGLDSRQKVEEMVVVEAESAAVLEKPDVLLGDEVVVHAVELEGGAAPRSMVMAASSLESSYEVTIDFSAPRSITAADFVIETNGVISELNCGSGDFSELISDDNRCVVVHLLGGAPSGSLATVVVNPVTTGVLTISARGEFADGNGQLVEVVIEERQIVITDPTPTPTPTQVTTPTMTPTATPTVRPTVTVTTTPVPTLTPTLVPTAIPTLSPSPTATPTRVSSPTSTPVPTITPSPTIRPTKTPTLIPTQTPTPTTVPTSTPTPSVSATPMPEIAGVPFEGLPSLYSSCTVRRGIGDWSHNPHDSHYIPGEHISLTGRDDVFNVGDGHFLQCFCEAETNSGIQSQWWNVENVSNKDIAFYIAQGWNYELGKDWNLMDKPYLVKNERYNCRADGGNGETFVAAFWNLEHNTWSEIEIPDREADLYEEVSTVSYRWGHGDSPGDGVAVNWFAGRWERAVEIEEASRYRLVTESDDGVRVWVDDVLVIDNWTDHGETRDEVVVELEPGRHMFKVEYYDRTGDAVLEFDWVKLEESWWERMRDWVGI